MRTSTLPDFGLELPFGVEERLAVNVSSRESDVERGRDSMIWGIKQDLQLERA